MNSESKKREKMLCFTEYKRPGHFIVLIVHIFFTVEVKDMVKAYKSFQQRPKHMILTGDC